MRLFPTLPAAMAAAISLAAPGVAAADSPVVIEGGDGDMRDTLRELLPDRDRPQSLFDAERIAEEAAERAMVWLRSEGYYGATVTPEATEEPPAARLVINPGPRFSFSESQIEYAGAAPDSETQSQARAALEIVAAGAPARAREVLDAEATALGALLNGGYPDASAQPRRVVVDHASSDVSTEFRFDAGARARLGGISANTDAFRPGFIDDLQNWATGDIYTPDALARLRRDLSSTGAVSRVTTQLGEPNANGVREVILELEPARRNAYELGVSYSTNEGPGLVAEWTRRNLTGRADALTIGGTLAEQQQDLSIELARPHAAGLGHTVTFGAGVEREAPSAYTRTGASIYASVDASTRLELGRSYGLRLTASQYDDLVADVSEAVVLTGFYAIRRDTTEFTLDPLEGSTIELRVEPSVSSGDETLGFVRGTAEGRVYRSFGREDSLTLAARIRGGWLEAVAGDANNVPPDRRFYAGGGGSVRGYDYNSIYPLERVALGLTPGGQGLLEGSVEARWRFGARLGAVAFVDAGTAFDSWDDTGEVALGVGIGARYDLGFAPLRFDVAFPLNDEFTTDDYALYISIGQAF